MPSIKRYTTNRPDFNASFASVWDGGTIVITPCHVNLETGEVTDIVSFGGPEVEELEVLEREFITLNGEEYPVISVDEPVQQRPADTFWVIR